jgi:hypothetical protein
MAAPAFPDPKRPRRPASPAQIAAGRRNWATMLLTGALGQLRWIQANGWVAPESRADLDLAIKVLARIDGRRKAAALPANGWARATEDIVIGNDDGDTVEAGDWCWRDPEGRIRRAYGFLGGGCLRACTWNAEGWPVCGVEARDEEAIDKADLDDPTAVHLKWRAVVETYPIEFAP